MSKLHSNASAHSLKQTKEIITRAFKGLKFEEIFDEFIEEPLGVGAMAQVYKAKLSKDLIDNGNGHCGDNNNSRRMLNLKSALELVHLKEKDFELSPSSWVVVKVLHPTARRTVERDLEIMKFFAVIISWLPNMEWLSLPQEVDTFGKMMMLQLDLQIEADNLLVFRDNFHGRRDVVFPKPYIDYSSKEVLVEEYIEGIPMRELLHQAKEGGRGLFEKEVSDIGLDVFLKMMLLDNFIHSDLHPGNIYVQLYKIPKEDHLGHYHRHHVSSEEVEAVTRQIMTLKDDKHAWRKQLDQLYAQGYRPRLCFIDTGLVTELNSVNRRNFLDLFKAISAFDGYRVWRVND